jgi:glycosyltransferase involved in cell wall biosynthesis
MASGLPIITTCVGAHEEAVEQGESGFVIDPDDGRTLGDRLEQLVGDPELVVRMGRRSRQIGEERFDMDKNANRIADLLVSMAQNPSGMPQVTQ